MHKEFINEINKINKNILKNNVDLKNYNTMKTKSICKCFIEPTSYIELKKVMELIKKYKVKYYILGNGSNVIFTSKQKECIIKLNFNKNKDFEIVNSNELLSSLAYSMYKKGYSGLEYLSFIPASVGGAIVMNAGCYNHNFSDIIEYVYYLDEDLNFKVIKKENCDFSYRNSLFKNSKKIVLGCKIKLINGDKEKIKEIMEKCINKRKSSQPLEYPNSGSIFKNLDDVKAWKLIEDSGLKGYKYKDALVSDKHSNFIVNTKNASGEDIRILIDIIKAKVFYDHKVKLESEVIIID